MLIISRKKNEKIVIADNIEITILEVGRNKVRFGINAPKSVSIQTNQKPAPEVSKPVEVLEPVAAEEPLVARVAAATTS